MTPDIKSQTDWLISWVTDKALPFWASTAIDNQGGFYEDLDLSGQARTHVVRRFRVQARQLYVYALATQLGWIDGREILRTGFDFMMDKGFEVDNQLGFIHLLNADYSVNDPKRDLYDHAFYLLAAAWVHRVINHPKSISSQKAILSFLESDLRSETGGWKEGSPSQLPRRQNPHMHMFETCLNWMAISDDEHWRTLADEILDLFKTRFFDPKTHSIIEFFEADWTPLKGRQGKSREPGHAAEWIWLLRWYQRQTGVDTSQYSNALYNKLNMRTDIFLNDEENSDDKVLRNTKRLWCQTELIKAHLAQAESGISGAAEMASSLMYGFRQTYLNENGTWIDQLDHQGRPCANTIPASTFYHIICMISEARRLCN